MKLVGKSFNTSESNYSREIVQVAVLLPNTYKYAELESIDQRRSGSGILAGFQSASDLGLVNDVVFNVTFRDTQCDNNYSPKVFIDAMMDGVDVLFGPTCEYALGKHQFSLFCYCTGNEQNFYGALQKI